MKNKILDIPFKESFKDFLKKDEKILWEGAPSLKVPIAQSNDDIDMVIYLGLIITTLVMLFAIAFYPIVLIALLVLVVVGSYFVYLKNNQKHHIRYAITSQQVLFQLPKRWSKGHELHHINFDNIRVVEIYADPDFDNVGVVFIKVKNNKSIRFKTRNLRTGKKRYLPTLELIDNPQKVVELIQQGIENINTLS